VSDDLRLDSGLVIPGDELTFTAVRAGGPGGQNVNKVSTKIELRFDLARNRTLPEGARARLRARHATRMDAVGRLIVTCDVTRSQSRNLELARDKLRGMLSESLVVPKKRRPTRPSRGAKEARLSEKRRRGEKKRGRSGDWD
jgi:ribosome-associated protein